jgi:hypothetical protein
VRAATTWRRGSTKACRNIPRRSSPPPGDYLPAMARIVINSWGSYGDVNPYLALAVALSERGHEAVMALPEHFRDDVTRLGLPFHPVGRAIDLTSDEMPKLVEKLMDPRYGTTYLFRDVMMPSLRESYRQLREVTESADMVVSQPLGFAAPLIAELTGIRWVSTVLAPLSFASGYEMSVPPPLPSLKKLEVLGPWVAHFFARVMRVVSARWVEPVQQFRAELGLPRGKHPIFEGHFAAPLVLAMFSRVLATPAAGLAAQYPRHRTVGERLGAGPVACATIAAVSRKRRAAGGVHAGHVRRAALWRLLRRKHSRYRAFEHARGVSGRRRDHGASGLDTAAQHADARCRTTLAPYAARIGHCATVWDRHVGYRTQGGQTAALRALRI